MVIGLGCCAAATLLAACERPAWTDPEQSRASRTQPQFPPRFGAAGTRAGLMAETPAWAAGLINQAFFETFQVAGRCLGNVDGAPARKAGKPGRLVYGWGWDLRGEAPSRILLVDLAGRIVGAGEAGLARPDVTAARPEVGSERAGWMAATSLTEGPLDAFGLLDDGGACRLGHVEL